MLIIVDQHRASWPSLDASLGGVEDRFSAKSPVARSPALGIQRRPAIADPQDKLESITMRASIPLALALLVIVIPARAQTTGIPGFNDYTINAIGSGSTSCTSITVLTPSTVTFQVSGTPLTPVMIYISFVPCLVGPPSPFTCQGTSLDLAPFPAPLPLSAGLTDVAGNYTFSLTLPPISPPITIGTQSLLLCVPSFLPLFTQAYDLTLT